MRSLGLCIHGEPGTGKSWCGATAPAPRLILDAEGGSRFAPGRKVTWNPKAEDPPKDDGTWDTCLVPLHDFSTMEYATQWLVSGKHPFRSVVLDSITEVQKRVIDQTSGTNQPTQQDWGSILRVTEDQVRKVRDLLTLPSSTIECVVLIALTHMRDGKFRPYLKGALELSLPGFVDVVGYMYAQPNVDGEVERHMLIAPLGDYEAKDRTHALTEKYGSTITNPDLEEFLQVIDSATS